MKHELWINSPKGARVKLKFHGIDVEDSADVEELHRALELINSYAKNWSVFELTIEKRKGKK